MKVIFWCLVWNVISDRAAMYELLSYTFILVTVTKITKYNYKKIKAILWSSVTLPKKCPTPLEQL